MKPDPLEALFREMERTGEVRINADGTRTLVSRQTPEKRPVSASRGFLGLHATRMGMTPSGPENPGNDPHNTKGNENV